MRPARTLLIALFLMAAPARAVAVEPHASEALHDLIARVADAYGGRAALAKVRAYRIEGRIVAVRQGRGGPTTRLFARPSRLRVELRYPEEPEVRILDGGKGWRGIGDGDPEPVSGPLLESMILQAARADVPWILLERAGDARIVEPLDHRGRMLVGIEIPLEAGLTLRAYVDPATHHVEVSEGTLVHGGMQTGFRTVYGDFRRVKGVLFAFREENFASGAHTGYTAIERVTLNPRVRPPDFAPPAPERSSS